jgi:leader peptidase (prepilin peptidase) / N-methyltransferase
MVILILFLLGLCLGSFVNALVWRVRESELEAKKKSPDRSYLKNLSITKGRSMCPYCKHDLALIDLIPLVSWLSLRGKCRYCKKPISVQYPLVELITGALFVLSYKLWPSSLVAGNATCATPHLFRGAAIHSNLYFILWLLFLTGLVALFVYDLRWYLLPNRIVYPLGIIAFIMSAISILSSNNRLTALINTTLAVLIGGGVFYLLYQVSKGKWIGGGDVKLGWVLGLVAGTPGKSVLFIFIASIIGTLISLPLLASNKLKRTSTIPFGPLLIIGLLITVFFGPQILDWYQHFFLGI